MKKALFLFLGVMLMSCSTINGELNSTYAGKKVYFCSRTDYSGMSAGLKTIDSIEYINSTYAHIYFIEENGNKVERDWQSMNNIHKDMPRYLSEYPFCSKEEYEKMLQTEVEEHKQMLQKEAKNKIDNEDCKQAQEKAYQARKNLGYHDIMIYSNNEFVDLNNKIVQMPRQFPRRVIGFTSKGIIISVDCSDVKNLNNVLGDMGGFIKMAGMFLESSCSEDTSFIYTNYKSYGTNEIFNGRGLVYIRSGSYQYKNKAGITTSVPAYKETNHKISEIEYKTYLKDKQLKCCIKDGKTKVCN